MSLRQQNKVRARAIILNAAHELIAEEGVQAATTREIARRAGVSYQTLYNYFPTKADIAGALLETEAAAWAHSVESIVQAFDADLLGSIQQLLEATLDQINGPNKELWSYIALSALNKELPAEDFGSALALAHDPFHTLLSAAQAVGHLSEDLELSVMTSALFNLIDYAMLRYFMNPQDSEAFVADQMALIGLLVRPYVKRVDHPS